MSGCVCVSGGDDEWLLVCEWVGVFGGSGVGPPTGPNVSLCVCFCSAGFTPALAKWMSTNLQAVHPEQLSWSFDLDGIAQMYRWGWGWVHSWAREVR